MQAIQTCLGTGALPFDVILLAQADAHRSNLGALLNAGMRMLNNASHDQFAFVTERFICPAYVVSTLRLESAFIAMAGIGLVLAWPCQDICLQFISLEVGLHTRSDQSACIQQQHALK